MNCAVIDDEITSLEIIGGLCKRYEDIKTVNLFSSPIDCIKFMNKTPVDLIFLDIHMPNFDGFDFLETLNKNNFKAILITSDKNQAIKAFKFDCVVDYIVKPIDLNYFDLAVKKAISQISNENFEKDNNKKILDNHIFININKRLIKINFDEMLVIKANGDYVNILTKTKTHIVHTTLKSIESKLPKDYFFKCHRSYIVNLKFIDEIEENSLIIKKQIIPVGKSVRQNLFQKLNLL